MVAQGKSLPDDLKVAFNSFLAKVEEYWLPPPTKEPNTPLGSAYYTFWKKFNKQTQVGDVRLLIRLFKLMALKT